MATQRKSATMLAPTGAIVPMLTAPLARCTTIDATLGDYLNNARAGTPNAAPNTSVQIAAVALAEALDFRKPPTQVANIVGHAMEGLIVTGSGQAIGTIDQHIGIDNESTWTQPLSKMSGCATGLILYGCHVGAYDQGAQLLYDLARVVGTNVYGPTGLIYCDSRGDFSLESGSQWQMATPQSKPQPIAQPQISSPPSGDVHLHLLNNVVRTTLEQVSQAAYQPHPAIPQAPAGAVDAQGLAREVHWDAPFTPPGPHAALLTGLLHLKFGFGERMVEKQFSVFNHTLLQDDDNPGVCYRASSQMRTKLAA